MEVNILLGLRAGNLTKAYQPSGLSSLFMWVRGLDFFVDCKEEKHDIHSM